MIQTPTLLFDISKFKLHGLSLEELSDRWSKLTGEGRKEIIVRSLELSARMFPHYLIDEVMKAELPGLAQFLFMREVQTVINVLAHKGKFTGMRDAWEYNAK